MGSSNRGRGAQGLAVVVAALTLPAAAQAATTLTRGPYPQDLGSRSVAIMFGLSAPAGASVEVTRGLVAASPSSSSATSADASNVVHSTTATSAHELVVGGLQPATTYRYAVKVDDGVSESGSFTTAPEDDRPFNFLLYGDNRSDDEAHAKIVAEMRDAPADFLIQTGDMVADGASPELWDGFFRIEGDLLRDHCIFPVLGNHEVARPGGDGVRLYGSYFRLPSPPGSSERYYTFRWGSARFFMLDAQNEFVGDETTWLENALARADAEPGLVWRFAVVHHGPFSAGLHGPNSAMVVAKIPEMMRKHRVDAVFSGHDHIYERGVGGGLRYVVSGGGGAPLYKQQRLDRTTDLFEPVHHFLRLSVSRDVATMKVERIDGSIVEDCSFTPTTDAVSSETWSCKRGTPAPLPVPSGHAAAMSATATPKVAPSPSTTASATTESTAPPSRSACGCRFVGNGKDGESTAIYGLSALGVAVVTSRRRKRSRA